ncbi:hypothetical protein GCM10009114_33230 [Aliiglaciecola litoralis]|uniref:Uncharacterized protein n=2 Tax=Aliiglaciecola litoralis TaxID=582857 RepID=A0ABP3X630_9ALTE
MLRADKTTSIESSILSSQADIWKSKQLKHYSFLLDSTCHDAKNLRVEVRDNIQVWPKTQSYPTIEELFQFIEKAKVKADYVADHYDPQGFPRFVRINWNKDYFDFMCGFDVTNVQKLSGLIPLPTIQTRVRVKEPRFRDPDMFPYDLSFSLGRLYSQEEIKEQAKSYARPESIIQKSLL